MSFADKTTAQRHADVMWDHSERIFEGSWPHRWTRYGLNAESEAIDTWKMPAFLRHAPDYIAQVGNGEPFFLEVQGTGKPKDGEPRTHKFKTAKLDELKKWNRSLDVVFWLWDDWKQQWTLLSYRHLYLWICRGMAAKGAFDNGQRPYWAVPVDLVAEQSDLLKYQERLGG